MAEIETIKVFYKDPDATLIYMFDWANDGPNDASLDDDGWLQSATISSSSFVLSSTDLTNVIDTNDDTTASIKLSGGKHGKDYTVTNRVVTNGGETEDRSIKIKCRHR
jgi:hypothetical protein